MTVFDFVFLKIKNLIMLSSIINADEVFHLKNNNDLVLIDASNGKNAQENYIKSHLQNAIFIDLNTQLSDIKENAAFGGRHPLPSIVKFCQLLGKMGISESSHIVIYDDKNAANAAARLWWMLKSVGHKKVQVINGGIQQAIKMGYPTSSGLNVLPETHEYKASSWNLPLSNLVEVESRASDPNHLIIDVREAARYNGELEPIDLIAGHIPGAINIPFIDNLDADGLFLDPDTLRQKYETILNGLESSNVIVHCGSGVTACHTLLAMDYAGMSIPKLYIGSWSEWSRNRPNAIATNSGFTDHIKIIDYTPEYAKVFADLNKEWIAKYFEMEEADYKALDHADEYIIANGGHIFIALVDDEPLGVCAMIKLDHPKYGFELAKMAVSPKAQGKKLGWRLAKAVINKARGLDVKYLVLESNTILVPAINLYRKLGFTEIKGNSSPYKRSNIQMELVL
jgi:thiosulfate/3-mercaptopyruvate sulfurtransferase